MDYGHALALLNTLKRKQEVNEHHGATVYHEATDEAIEQAREEAERLKPREGQEAVDG